MSLAKPTNTQLLHLDNQLCFALYSTSLAMTQLYKPLLEPLGLTYPQYLILLVLWQKDGCGLKDVADQLGQMPGALTPVIKRMESEGWLSRTRSREDERHIHIHLSEKAWKLQTEATGIMSCVFEKCATDVNDLINLKNRLTELRDNLRK